MKDLAENKQFRQKHPVLGWGDESGGYFIIPSHCKGENLRVIATSTYEWDHVSVSLSNRCPTWEEMELIKRLFFKDDECVMQLHPPLADYLNFHPFCLHLWRPQKLVIPCPPKWMIAPRT